MFDVVTDNVIEKVVNNRNENVSFQLQNFLSKKSLRTDLFKKDIQGICDDLLVTKMRSYVQTQRDDILIMVCKLEVKK